MLYELKNLEKYNEDRRLPLVRLIERVQFIIYIIITLTIAFWFLSLLGILFPPFIVQIFDCINFIGTLVIKDAVFINGSYIHLSFVVTVAILLCIVKFLDYLIEVTININNQINLNIEKKKKEQEEKINQKRHEEYIKEESKNNKILIMIRFNVECLTQRMKQNEVKITPKTVMSDFFGMLEGNLDECSTDFVDDDLLLIFNPFDNIDNFIRRLNNIFKALEKKYTANKYKISMYIAADTAARNSQIQARQEKLVNLLALSIKNKVVCVETFKKRYAIKKFPNWNIQSIGTYNIDGSSTQEIFVMEPLENDSRI